MNTPVKQEVGFQGSKVLCWGCLHLGTVKLSTYDSEKHLRVKFRD